MTAQSGLLDAIPVPDLVKFRLGRPAALDREAADAVGLIQKTGTLDDRHNQAVQKALENYVKSVAPRPAAEDAGKKASVDAPA